MKRTTPDMHPVDTEDAKRYLTVGPPWRAHKGRGAVVKETPMKRLILASKAAAFSWAVAAPAMAQNYYYVVPTNPNAQVSSFPTEQFDAAKTALQRSNTSSTSCRCS
jgi:hypothetical protein